MVRLLPEQQGEARSRDRPAVFYQITTQKLPNVEDLSIDGAVLNSVAQIAGALAPCRSLVHLSLRLNLQNGVQNPLNGNQLPVLPSVKSLR